MVTAGGRAATAGRCSGRVGRLLAVATLLVGAACTSSVQDNTVSSDRARCPQGGAVPIAGFPDVALHCLTGPGMTRVSLTHGRPEVINMWASWCYPCREEIGELEQAHRRLGTRVLFLGIDERDQRAPAVAFLGDHGVSYPQAMDPNGHFARALGFLGVPNTIAIDAAGHVVYRYRGQLTAAALDDLLAALGIRSEE